MGTTILLLINCLLLFFHYLWLRGYSHRHPVKPSVEARVVGENHRFSVYYSDYDECWIATTEVSPDLKGVGISPDDALVNLKNIVLYRADVRKPNRDRRMVNDG
jgi:hypothetical protein